MRRPIEYFLSHQNLDRDAVVDLEGALRRRGLASWRDRRSLLAGDDNDMMIRSGIDNDTSGFVLYGSGNLSRSWYVWHKEWPWACERRDRERAAGDPTAYRIVPLLVDGMDRAELQAAAATASQPDPMAANWELLCGVDDNDRDRIARWLLRGALADRAKSHSDPIKIRLTTFPGAVEVGADVLVDWAPEFSASPVNWDLLGDAIRDLKDELAAIGRPIEIDAHARISAAFAFGHAFPWASRIPLTAIHRDGSRWSIGSAPDPSLVTLERSDNTGGDSTVAVIEVAFGRSLTSAIDADLADLGLSPATRVRLGPASEDASVEAPVAGAAAFTFGRVMRNVRDVGVREAHVFIAGPAALAVLLGASVNAGPAMTLYYTRDGRYERATRLT